MATDVTEVQKRVATVIDQSASAPTAGGADWNLRLSYINQAQNEWAETSLWRVLFKESNANTTTSTANATIPMPSDFRKLASFPRIIVGGQTTDFSEIRPEEKAQKEGTTDNYCYQIGSPGSYKLIIYPSSDLVSGASIYIPYIAEASSLASPADVSVIPNPEYLVKRTVAYIWESLEDTKFPQAKAEADKILARMLEFEVTHTDAAEYGRVRTREEKRSGFKWGRD